MRRLVLATLALVAPAVLPAQTRMLRSPSISGNQIVFAYANNVWIVESSGGVARRITSFQGLTENPKLSPDGSQVAFSAMYGGNVDVYVVPSVGGEPKRLTWHPAADEVQGWTPDGKSILFESARGGDAPQPVPRFYEIPVTGGIEQPLAMPRAYQGKISPDGKRLAYRMNNSWDEERRNYRGGQNRPIWILDFATDNIETPPWTDSKEMDPAWVGDVVYFLSDRDGVSNVWSYDTKAKKLNEATHFTDFDVKTLDATSDAVVFEQAGYVHLLDPKTDREHIVNITAAGDFPWMMPQWKDVSNRVTALALSPTGKRAAVEARGEIFTIPAEKGDARDLTKSSSSAERDPAWSPDGRSVSYFSDKSGEYKLYIESQDGVTPPREITLPEPSHFYTPSWSPDDKHIVYTDTKLRVWVLDVASGQAKAIGNDEFMIPERSLNPVWSPDGQWLAYAKRLPSMYRAIFTYNVNTGETKQVTDGLADANWAAWDASGKYLWFLASTNFALNSAWLDMSSYDRPQTRALYLAVLRKSDPSPVLPESDEEIATLAGDTVRAQRPARPDSSAFGTRGDTGASRADRAPRVASVRIDFDGLQQRIIAIPGVAQRNYTQLRAGPSGTVFFVEPIPATGTQEPPGGGFFGGPSGTIHRYQLKDRKAAPFVTGAAQYVVSADGHKLLYRTAGQQGGLYLVDADRMIPTAGQGHLPIQLRAYIDPKAEFKQMFDEGWRNQRDYLYVPNMHGSDWPRMKQMYGQLLPYVNHREDLNYLLDMMGAEIAIGHSFVRGGDMPEVPQSVVGQLGADFTIDNGRYKITKIYDAESWNPELRAPLAGPGIDVHVGDYIVAIGGQELRAPDNINRLLDGTANKQTVLAVNSKPTTEGARRVIVVPVANESGLRSRAWIEHNRHVVDSLSHGQLAYVYLPNTAQPGYASFNRYYFAQQEKKGAILDERYNGGGSAADYIIDILGRDFDGYFNNPVGDRYPFTSPAAGIWGPKVMIINEMAGSGGDLMPYMFQHRHIGPLVGKRTWGGLVGTWDTPAFVDGGSMIAPRGGFFDKEGHWAVENVGTSPDIDVENWPKDVIAGHDPQLERAVAQAMKMLQEHPVARLTKEPPPPTWGKRTTVVP
ncbi:MAG TPA: PDZ domain-containing protein [Gemmatimonadaceae bacterium]